MILWYYVMPVTHFCILKASAPVTPVNCSISLLDVTQLSRRIFQKALHNKATNLGFKNHTPWRPRASSKHSPAAGRTRLCCQVKQLNGCFWACDTEYQELITAKLGRGWGEPSFTLIHANSTWIIKACEGSARKLQTRIINGIKYYGGEELKGTRTWCATAWPFSFFLHTKKRESQPDRERSEEVRKRDRNEARTERVMFQTHF